jgi:uncharacterized protein (TIGR00290 family)
MILSWSGGKDSALALWKLINDAASPVRALVTTVTDGYDRISMHGIRRSILHVQARYAGLPVFEASIKPGSSNDEYERTFLATLEEARVATRSDTAVAFGDLFLADVRAYREQLLIRHGWTPHFPLWGIDTAKLAQDFIEEGFQAILCCVDTQQMDSGFAGREFDAGFLRDIPAGIDPCGERGEFHTCVHGGPIFSSPIELTRGERVLRDDRFEYCDLLLR